MTTPKLKTTAQQRDHWRRDVPIRGLLRNDFVDMLVDDVDTLLAEVDGLTRALNQANQGRR